SIALVALVVGFMFSLLYGDAPGAGANITLGAAIFFAGWFFLSRFRAIPLWRKLCAAAAIMYGAAAAFRASELLFAVNLLLGFGFTALACSPSCADKMKAAGAIVADAMQTGFNAVFGSICLLREISWRGVRVNSRQVGMTGRVLTGLFISVPF